MKSTATLLLLSAVAACGPVAGDDAHPDPEQFAPVYAEMLIHATDPESGRGASGAERQDSILASAGMTREQFNATVEWYNREPARWGDLLQNVVRYLQEKSDRPGERGPPEAPGQPDAPKPAQLTSPMRRGSSPLSRR